MNFSHSLFLWKWPIRFISFSFMIYLPISFESSSELEEKWVNNFKGYSGKAIQFSLKWLIILYFEVNFYSSDCTKGCLSYWRFSFKSQWKNKQKKVLCPAKQGYCGFQEIGFSISQEFFLFCGIIILQKIVPSRAQSIVERTRGKWGTEYVRWINKNRKGGREEGREGGRKENKSVFLKGSQWFLPVRLIMKSIFETTTQIPHTLYVRP